ncbi:MATE family efflux transporter [Anoxynatronum buryatiense]|uniref:Probable multidrug resistance protein NorM n=1 Tax=Anoxynatronum buryatiense TaxID=489973 RepID=A0AA46AIZ1_9CLOT|nr:MATE family efflux transporter [Anoxynatronum buryatiense]SMP55939.1 putative efflux protein, MATE family [Anoxynatronum buryatiense]
MKEMFQDKVFFKSLFVLGIPVAIQHMISSSLNMVDVVMIGQINEVSITAVGLANQLFFVLILLLFGINSGGAIFTAQFWGRKDRVSVHRATGVCLVFSLGGGALFNLLAWVMPEFIITLFSKDPQVVRLGASYLRIVGFSYLFTAVSICLATAARSVGDAKMPMRASAISLGLNTGLNAVLIFGLFGFPALGVQGAAIATVIARLLEMVIILIAIQSTEHPLKATAREYLSFTKAFTRRVVVKSLPVVANEFFWALGMTLYVAAYSHLGTEAYAAYQIAQTIERLFFVAAMGIGSAAAVMIGNLLGENRRDDAIRYSRYFNVLTAITGLALAVILIVTAPRVVRFFNVPTEVQQNAVYVMWVIGVCLC